MDYFFPIKNGIGEIPDIFRESIKAIHFSPFLTVILERGKNPASECCWNSLVLYFHFLKSEGNCNLLTLFQHLCSCEGTDVSLQLISDRNSLWILTAIMHVCSESRMKRGGGGDPTQFASCIVSALFSAFKQHIQGF